MNWDAVGAVAELLGALGVIISLLYLAGQIRTANRASAVSAKLNSTRLITNYLDDLIADPKLAELIHRARKDEDLSREEFLRFSNCALKAFYYFSAGYFQNRLGTLTDASFREQLGIIDYWLRGSAVRSWWTAFGRDMFEHDFVQFIDERFEIVAARQRASQQGRTD